VDSTFNPNVNKAKIKNRYNESFAYVVRNCERKIIWKTQNDENDVNSKFHLFTCIPPFYIKNKYLLVTKISDAAKSNKFLSLIYL